MTTALKQAAQSAQQISKEKALASLGGKLFSNQALSLNPTAIVSLLKSAGINVPKGVVVTADMAQIIVSGGAFISDLNQGLGLSSFALPTAELLQASIDLLGQIGWLDPKSPAAQLLTLGSDVAMVVATGGVNILADLKLAVDLIQDLFGQPDAQALANQSLSQFMSKRRAAQTDALSENFKEYHEGTLSVFGLMGKIAEESPDYFQNYFPDQSKFFPVGYITFTQSATTSGLANSNVQTAYAQTTIKSLYKNDHQTIENILWNQFVNPLLLMYKKLQDSQTQNNKMSVRNLALLSLMPPYINEFPENFDMSPMLKKLMLTPNDLGEQVISKFLSASSKTISPAITYNGVDTYVGGSTSIALNPQQTQLMQADKLGRIDIVLQNQQAAQYISNWATPAWSVDAITNTLPSTGQKFSSKLVSSAMLTQPQRNIRNYWSALSILEQVKNDQYFSDMKSQIQTYDFLTSLDDMNQRHKDLLFKVQCRSLNLMAYKNIAQAMNVPLNKLKLVKHAENGSPAVFQ